MYDAHQARGLQILAVPCNQFGMQEPWPEQQITEWVAENYGCTFPMLTKCDVKGNNIHPLYAHLKAESPGSEIKWNFAKYLVDGEGRVVKFYEHAVEPITMLAEIEPLLNQQ